MSSPLIIKNVEYVPAKEAGKLVGYTSDYVGQLCRGDKLECVLVGRAWYVLPASILAHKKVVQKEVVLRGIKHSRALRVSNSRHRSSGPVALRDQKNIPFVSDLGRVPQRASQISIRYLNDDRPLMPMPHKTKFLVQDRSTRVEYPAMAFPLEPYFRALPPDFLNRITLFGASLLTAILFYFTSFTAPGYALIQNIKQDIYASGKAFTGSVVLMARDAAGFSQYAGRGLVTLHARVDTRVEAVAIKAVASVGKARVRTREAYYRPQDALVELGHWTLSAITVGSKKVASFSQLATVGIHQSLFFMKENVQTYLSETLGSENDVANKRDLGTEADQDEPVLVPLEETFPSTTVVEEAIQ